MHKMAMRKKAMHKKAMRKKMAILLSGLVAGALVLSACSGGSGSSSSKDPIVVGSVNTKSGKATFPEAAEAAKAYFDKVNADGGIKGRKIKYTSQDDKGDPKTAQSAARQIVGSDEAVAMVGGASLIECEANSKYYEQEDIYSMPGIGVDPNCFDTPNIATTNVGPFNDLILSLMYGAEKLHLKNICVLLEIAGNTRPAYEKSLKKWSKVTGKKIHYIDDSVPYGGKDYTSYIVKAKNKGCDAVAGNPVEPDAIGWLKAAHAQNWNDVTWLLLTSEYSRHFAKAVDHAGKGVYVPAEFYPYTEKSKVNKDWSDLMKKKNIDLTAFSQGGFLAAKNFVKVLKGMDGDIDRDSVRKALQHMKPSKDPMLGTPYHFGKSKTHNKQTAGWPIKLQSGSNQWKRASDDWLRIPKN